MFEITFLGTGSAVPTGLRNLSGTALTRQGEIFLFDCGEGTQMQLRRARLKPGRIRHICITHFHGDHLFGLPGLLTSLHMAGCKQTIFLYGPAGLGEFVRFHQNFAQFELGYPLVINEIPAGSEKIVWPYEGFDLIAMPLQHRMTAYGFALREHARPGKFDEKKATALGIPFGPERRTLIAGEPLTLPDGRIVHPEEVVGPERPGLRLAFCLDTSPCEAAVELGRNADLLIHDATFAHGDEELARVSGHSTATQAAEIARRAGARSLALTHLSSRITPQDEQAFLRPAQDIFPGAFLARDLLRIKIDYEE